MTPFRRALFGVPGLITAGGIVTILDFALAVTGAYSVVLTVLTTLLVAPWVKATLELGREEVRKSTIARIRNLAVHALSITLLGLFLVAKWLVLLLALREPSYAPSYRSYTFAAFATKPAPSVITRAMSSRRGR